MFEQSHVMSMKWKVKMTVLHNNDRWMRNLMRFAIRLNTYSLMDDDHDDPIFSMSIYIYRWCVKKFVCNVNLSSVAHSLTSNKTTNLSVCWWESLKHPFSSWYVCIHNCLFCCLFYLSCVDQLKFLRVRIERKTTCFFLTSSSSSDVWREKNTTK